MSDSRFYNEHYNDALQYTKDILRSSSSIDEIKMNLDNIKEVIKEGLKIPHIGWNKLDFTKKESKLFKYIKNNDFVYFVHSYYGAKCEDDTIATSDYGYPLTAAVEKDNVFGCQFHPEKSGKVGLSMLKAFNEVV